MTPIVGPRGGVWQRDTGTARGHFTKIEYKYTPYDDKHKACTPVSVTYDLTTPTK